MKIKTFTSGGEIDKAYVGIDPSLTGFAISLYSGSEYDVRVLKPESTGAERLYQLRTYVIEHLGNYEVADVYMEGLAFSQQSSSTSKLGELSGVIKEALYSSFSLRPVLVPPSTLKKYVAGTGRSVAKSLMMLQTYKKWGIELTDDNAADAYGLSRMCAGIADTVYEADVVMKMGDPKFRD